jgi:hypothetical protein
MGLQHIIYLGGMIPDQGELSWHLKSRLEVEEALRSSSIPVTTLRAGLIIGENGSSFEILHRLVVRLPLMVCPAWTSTESQPIALREILEVLQECLTNPGVRGRVYDVGGPEVLSYQALILKTAASMGLRRKVYSFNLVPLHLSRFWVSLISGAPRNLVYPLVLSLIHRMVASPERVWTFWKNPRVFMDDALREALPSNSALPKIRDSGSTNRGDHEVRSIQRLHHPEGKSAEWIAGEYFRWLPTLFAFLLRVRVEGEVCTFSIFSPRIRLLVLEKSVERSTPDRTLLYLKGGLLVSSKMGRGRLEFREALGGRVVLAAIHEFIPALPWILYRNTQALLHVWVMRRFDMHLLKEVRE